MLPALSLMSAISKFKGNPTGRGRQDGGTWLWWGGAAGEAQGLGTQELVRIRCERRGRAALQPHRAWVGERKSLQHLETTVPICLNLTEPVFYLQNEDVVMTSPACGEDSVK